MEWQNKLYFGDNLDILGDYVAEESVDLIYLDPPFNKKATYSVLFHEKNGSDPPAQVAAFDDTWHWDGSTPAAYDEVVTHGPKQIADLLQALRQFLGTNDMMAYLTMMAIRLIELHRVLKPTGSIYLHCDPTASHYLKLLMDAVFGPENLRNEIIWHYRKWPTGKYQFQRNHDVVLFYSRSLAKGRAFNQLWMERAPSTLKRFGTAKIISAHDSEGRRIPSQVADYKSSGVRQDDVWDISRVAPVKQLFPTQKPEALLERIIKASSNEDDLVLDPFCGCGTTIAVAERFHRRWIGIDITHLAVGLMRHRLHDTFGPELSDYEVIGDPKDLPSARALAEQDRMQFQCWAAGLVDARATEKKGPDKGIDGHIRFLDDDSGKAKKIVVQVKSGHVAVSQIRDLIGVLDQEKAQIGAFITLREPTKPMREAAAAAGFYHPPGLLPPVPKLQILTIEELLAGKKLERPPARDETFRQAPRRAKAKRKVKASGEE